MLTKVLSILFSVLLILSLLFFLKIIFEKNSVYDVKNQGMFIIDVNVINNFCKNNLNPNTFSLRMDKGEEMFLLNNKLCLRYKNNVFCEEVFCNSPKKTIIPPAVINKIYNCNLTIKNSFLNINCK